MVNESLAVIDGIQAGLMNPVQGSGFPPLVILKLDFKRADGRHEYENSPVEYMTFALTPNQAIALIQDLTKPLLDITYNTESSQDGG